MQKDSSDALFTPKIDIFRQTILNTAHIKVLEIFPLARESLSIQTSTSRSVKESKLSSVLMIVSTGVKDLNFYMGLHTKRYMATTTRYSKQPFLHHSVIFKDSIIFFMLPTGLLMQR